MNKDKLKSAFISGRWRRGRVGRKRHAGYPGSAQTKSGSPTYHYLPANSDSVQWGYFSKLLKPQLEVQNRETTSPSRL